MKEIESSSGLDELVCFLCVFPIEVVVDGDPQVFGLICYCKGVASQVVLIVD